MIQRLDLRRWAMVAVVVATILAFGEARAAMIISALNSPITENFNGFDGTAATIPANFTWNTPGGATTSGGIYDAAGGYNNNPRWYALINSNVSATDRAFGARRDSVSPATNPYDLTWSFINQTGLSISEFQIAWDVKQFSQSNRATTIDFNYNSNATGVTTSGIAGTTLTTASTNGGAGANLSTPTVTNRAVNITLPSPLADGQSIDFRWILASGSGNMANGHIGVDNLSVTASEAVPEPSTALCGGLALAIAALVRLGRTEDGRQGVRACAHV